MRDFARRPSIRAMEEFMGEPSTILNEIHVKPVIIGAIAGIASIVGGVASWGVATSTIAYIAAGAMIVGGALSVVGNLTGNADLAKIGGILSLGGGIGSLMTSGWDAIANEFGSMFSGGEAATSAAGAATTPTDFGSLTATSSIDQLGAGIGLDGNVGGGLLNQGAAATGGMPAFEVPALNTFGQAAGGAMEAAPTLATVGNEATVAQAAGTNTAIDSMGGTQGIQATNATNPLGVELANAGATTAATASTQPTGLLGSVGEFIKNNKELVQMLGKGFESLSSGDKRKADQLYTEAATGNKQAESDLLKLKTQLMQQQATNASTVITPGLGVNPTAGNVTRNSTQFGRTSFA